MIRPPSNGRLEDQDRDQLLQTVRRLLAEADALSSRIAAVNEIGIAINRTLNLSDIQAVIAKQAKWLLDFEHCSVCLCVDTVWQTNTLFGPAESPVDNLLTTENVGQAVKRSQPQLIRTGSASPFLGAYRSQIIIPLVADEMILGTINFAATRENAYTQDDMRIGYMLALQLSSAIRNARNFQELNRTRDELNERNLELEATNQELKAYSHTIAHDLKSPLNSIILRSEIVSDNFVENMPPKGQSVVKGIRDSAVKMSEMIDQLLWLAKLRNVSAASVPVNMNVVASAAVRRFSHVAEGVQIEVKPDMPGALGHAQWVEEVFANLISNAIKYMGDDNPAPRITLRGSVEDGMGRYEVQDSGIGIEPADQAHLFEMFTRLNVVQVEGLGLGLSIIHRIVTKLNGNVSVTSTPGVGSTFAFTLPLALPSPSPVRNETHAPDSTHTS
ncbi:MAG: hypothetical protein GC204_00565 [Chloroflexi bacterium]|nr:hypothetical protein [Chloroflexota bacterium]